MKSNINVLHDVNYHYKKISEFSENLKKIITKEIEGVTFAPVIVIRFPFNNSLNKL
uniref:Uncharacterized protein n=1 Tax=Meloidogyne incognita TaxID=6306 RepID=A0A914KUF5_MELIC